MAGPSAVGGVYVDSQCQRRILLCVAGLTPQIVTETLYALAVAPDSRERFVPHEIHLVTTREGAYRARLNLIEEGRLRTLCTEYGIDPASVRFDSETIHVIRDATGAELADIRSADDNSAAADTITAVVRRLTAESGSCIHASIAGGRKTMTFFLGYAMSLFARPQDRLSHVLVNWPFESNTDFFYPPATPRVLYYQQGPTPAPASTADARITLADIPFVRLRGLLGDDILAEGSNYLQAVQRAQHKLEPPELVIEPAARRALCGGNPVRLSPASLAYYCLLARRARDEAGGIHWSDFDPAEFLRELAAIVSEHSGTFETAEQALDDRVDPHALQKYLEQRTARLNKTLRKALGPGPAAPYLVADVGQVPGSRRRLKGLKLRPNQVRIAE